MRRRGLAAFLSIAFAAGALAVSIPDAVTAFPQASFTFSPASAYVGQTVRYDASTSHDSDYPFASFEWDFGDGSNGSGMVADHVYGAPGTYFVNLTARNTIGESDTVTRGLVVSSVPEVTFVPYDHPAGFRLPVPATWDARRNELVNGTRIDLVVHGPVSQGVETNVAVLTAFESGVREDEPYLQDRFDGLLEDMRADTPDLEVLEGPSFPRIANHSAFVATFRYPSEVPPIAQKIAFVVSEPHRRYWILALTTPASLLVVHGPTFDAMVEGFEITLAPGAGDPTSVSSLGILVLLLVIVLVAVLVAAYLVKSRRRTPAASPPPPAPGAPAPPPGAGGVVYGPPPPPQAAPYAVPPPAPVTPRTARACGSCGTEATSPSQSFCTECGASLPASGEDAPGAPTGEAGP